MNLILVHICTLYWKLKANFFMELSLYSKPSHVYVTVLYRLEHMLLKSINVFMTGQPFYLGRRNVIVLGKKINSLQYYIWYGGMSVPN